MRASLDAEKSFSRTSGGRPPTEPSPIPAVLPFESLDRGNRDVPIG
jgi:hypothetical protein